MPKEHMTRLLEAPSFLAHIAVEKFCDGLPVSCWDVPTAIIKALRDEYIHIRPELVDFVA
jgi:hypothetical protein